MAACPPELEPLLMSQLVGLLGCAECSTGGALLLRGPTIAAPLILRGTTITAAPVPHEPTQEEAGLWRVEKIQLQNRQRNVPT